MQIPTPGEIEQRLNAEDQAKVDAAVPQIITALDEKFRGSEVWLGTFGLNNKSFEIVKRMFEAKGWRVRWQSDQRDGDSIVFGKA